MAATVGPGLIGALLVGVSAAKALAFGWDRPFVGVDHLEAHLFAPWLEQVPCRPRAACAARVGRPQQILHMCRTGPLLGAGPTLDDAAGEAFDKLARYLGPGLPGWAP